MSPISVTRPLPLLAAAATLLLATLAPLAARADDPGPGATPLSAFELLHLYGGRSWDWGDGAGYFATDAARSFTAYSGDTKAVGHWSITDRGRLCFSAVWKSPTSAVPAQTCFLHVAVNGTIYQRKLPDGAWYIFRHARPAPSDEARKLVLKNLVSAQLS